MKSLKSQISIILLTLGLSACFDPPTFPEIPVIEFNSLEYIDNELTVDSLMLRFDFEDGDGDIGLNSEDLLTPYHPFNIIVDSEDTIVTLNTESVVPPLYEVDPRGTRRLFSETDNRPVFNCNDYQITTYDFFGLGGDDLDTFYISKNEFHNNMHIDFYKKQNGQYSLVNFSSQFNDAQCINWDGRIPVFDSENLGKSINGTISYALISSGFPIVLRNDTFKLEFYIYDRQLNKSNVVETRDFTLPDITRD